MAGYRIRYRPAPAQKAVVHPDPIRFGGGKGPRWPLYLANPSESENSRRILIPPVTGIADARPAILIGRGKNG